MARHIRLLPGGGDDFDDGPDGPHDGFGAFDPDDAEHGPLDDGYLAALFVDAFVDDDFADGAFVDDDFADGAFVDDDGDALADVAALLRANPDADRFREWAIHTLAARQPHLPLPQNASPAFKDRLEFVQSASDEQLRRSILTQPMLAAALCGAGRLAHLIPRNRNTGEARPLTAEDLAAVFASSSTVAAAVETLSPQATRLMEAAAWRGGLTEEQAAFDFPDATPEELRVAAAELADAVLSNPAGAFVKLRIGVRQLVRLPAPVLREVYTGSSITNDGLDRMLRNLGVPIPSRREPKVDAVETALRDPEVLSAALTRMSAEARGALARMLHNRIPTRLQTLGVPYFAARDPRYGGRYAATMRVTPVHELVEAGLVMVDRSGMYAQPLLDTMIGVNGGRFGGWPSTAPIELAPLHVADAHPACVGRLRALLDLWSREPAAGTKAGSLAVYAVRSAAKHLHIPESDARLLAGLAESAGLLRRELVWTGKGRSATSGYEFHASPGAAVWAAQPFHVRWAVLVRAWLDGPVDPKQGDEVHRRTAVADLMALPRGEGARDLPRFLAGRRAMFAEAAVPVATLAALADELVTLGLVPSDGPRGLTDHARLLITDPDAAAEATQEMSRSFVVQADHTVIAPPDLDPDVAARLARLGTVQSRGSVTVLRLDSQHIAAELSSGASPSTITGFLVEHASTPVPPGVLRLVEDTARHAGGLSVHVATTVVSAPDAATLAKAIAVKAARLTAVSDTAAISPLALDKVMAALRAKGLAPEGPPPRAKRGERGEVPGAPGATHLPVAAAAPHAAIVVRPSIPSDGALARLLPTSTKPKPTSTKPTPKSPKPKSPKPTKRAGKSGSGSGRK